MVSSVVSSDCVGFLGYFVAQRIHDSESAEAESESELASGAVTLGSASQLV